MDRDNSSSFSVKNDIFEGPLELLLSLVEKRKLFINDVALSSVADEYVAYIKTFDDFPVHDAAHFLLVASTLVLIKSRSLLPGVKLSEDEVSDIETLERRLGAYQKIRVLSRNIAELYGARMMLPRTHTKEIRTPVFTPDAHTSLVSLKTAIFRVVQNFPKKESVPKAVVQKVISIEEIMERLIARVSNNIQSRFSDIVAVGTTEKIEIVVNFLAMLELVKQGTISVQQQGQFEDIFLEGQKVGVPSYL